MRDSPAFARVVAVTLSGSSGSDGKLASIRSTRQRTVSTLYESEPVSDHDAVTEQRARGSIHRPVGDSRTIATDRTLRFSIVIPAHNEEDNVAPLLEEIADVFGLEGPFETVLVDDGSTDHSVERAREWGDRHGAGWLRVVTAAQRGGQSAAVIAGVEVARAPIIATLDGDLQNDPHDLVEMIESIERGDCDAVFGIRVQRRDNWLRRASSRIGNAVRNWITGDRVTDAACGIKAVRRDLFLRVPRFDGMHRFMVTLVRYCGGRTVEVPVTHRPRHAGRAKYGVANRAWRGLRDCFGVRWLRSRVRSYEVREEE